MRYRNAARFLLAAVAVSGALLGACGNKPDTGGATSPTSVASTSAPSDSSTASTPPTDSSTASTPTTSASSTSTPPATPDLPASYLAAADQMRATGQKLVDVLNANKGDCNKLAAAVDKYVKDPDVKKSIDTFVAELAKLTPEQKKAAQDKDPGTDLKQKMDAMTPDMQKCAKNAKVKSSMTGLLKLFIGALAGAMGAPPN